MIQAGKWAKTRKTISLRDMEEVVVAAGTRGMVAHVDGHRRATLYIPTIGKSVNFSTDDLEED